MFFFIVSEILIYIYIPIGGGGGDAICTQVYNTNYIERRKTIYIIYISYI